MLSQIATDLTIALSKQISNTSFVIYSWEDIAALLSNEEKSCSKEECKNIFEEIMAKIFPNLKQTHTKMQEAQRIPNMLKPNKSTLRQTMLKMGKILK